MMSELSVNLNGASKRIAAAGSGDSKGRVGSDDRQKNAADEQNAADKQNAADEQNAADKQLMMRLARSDETAMRELLDRHGEMLIRLVGRLTAWHSDREDILQEVLLQVWQKAGSFRGLGSLEGWLKRTAVNRCRNHFRAKNSLKRLIDGCAAMLVRQNSQSGNATQTEEGKSSIDANEPLQDAMAKLAADDRTALVLFYLEELSGDEVAEILSIRIETLHVRLHRARGRLKKLMTEDVPARQAVSKIENEVHLNNNPIKNIDQNRD